MKYLIFAVATLFAPSARWRKPTAPAEPSEQAGGEARRPRRTPATAKDVGTKGRRSQAEADRKAQETGGEAKKKAARGRRVRAPARTQTTAADPPGSMMTADERTAYRTKLQSFKTLDECEAYTKAHDAEMETRAKAQHKAVRASTGAGCNQLQGCRRQDCRRQGSRRSKARPRGHPPRGGESSLRGAAASRRSDGHGECLCRVDLPTAPDQRRRCNRQQQRDQRQPAIAHPLRGGEIPDRWPPPPPARRISRW